MEGKILKVKEDVKDLLENYPDISDITILIGEDREDVTISVDILAKLADSV